MAAVTPLIGLDRCDSDAWSTHCSVLFLAAPTAKAAAYQRLVQRASGWLVSDQDVFGEKLNEAKLGSIGACLTGVRLDECELFKWILELTH